MSWTGWTLYGLFLFVVSWRSVLVNVFVPERCLQRSGSFCIFLLYFKGGHLRFQKEKVCHVTQGIQRHLLQALSLGLNHSGVAQNVGPVKHINSRICDSNKKMSVWQKSSKDLHFINTSDLISMYLKRNVRKNHISDII